MAWSTVKKHVWHGTGDYAPVRGDFGEHEQDDPRINLGATNMSGWRLGLRSLGSRMPSWVCMALLVTALATSILTFIGFLVAEGIAREQITYDRKHSCGNTSAEALALGCSFDHLTWSFYPPHCPHYTNDRFRAAEPDPFSYYETLGSPEPVDESDFFRVIESQGGVWVEKREHLTHCVYLLLAQGQIVRDGTRHTQIIVDYEHLEHCADILLKTLRKDDEWRMRNTFSNEIHYDQDC
ncbi:hypothetical protein V8F06_004454 [Rhypophila decipiens]